MYLVRVHPTYRWSAATIAGLEFVKHQSREFSEITGELQHAADIGVLEITSVQDSSAKSGKNGGDRQVEGSQLEGLKQQELSKPRRRRGTGNG